MFIGAGAVKVGTLYDWVPGPGSVVTWHPSAASLAKAREAPTSPVPASYMQAQHLRGFCEFAAQGLDYSRLVMGSWDIPGRCDIRAMTYVINSHLRRHDTYRSWFDYHDMDHIVRHTLASPADIEFVPTQHGEMTPAEWQHYLLSIPDPLHWECFSFGVIQRPDHFTFCVIVDHLHTDPMLMALLYMELYVTYNALVAGAAPVALPPAGSYDEYCVRQRQYTSTLSLDSPPVRKWIEFAENNGGTLPDFPLPLGDPTIPCGGDIVTEQLMDKQQTARFESACVEAGARFSGGLFACVALAQYRLTGAETYYGLTPFDKRSTPAEFLTAGWFTGVIPFTIPVDPTSFGETARAAQASFDSNTELANVPFDRVLELAPWLRRPGPNFTMLNYMDAGLPPLSAVVASHLDGANAGAYCDARNPAHLYMSVGRLFDEVSMTVFFPNNPVARESVIRYMEAVKSMCVRVAEGSDATAPLHNGAPALVRLDPQR
ncbi:condensation domain-containing protein [Mycobacterium botniense]|uniref:Acyltransferase papA1 n=1 Tax=Mycobacterium botniense TaxID=84962 RepID=A0A7I9Y1T2_9MYCO|nr:condensation domain-containing protein [Mycobacterium botniense]GFG76029.1 acyltransferase papA1 [Mycobacterium botniense]